MSIDNVIPIEEELISKARKNLEDSKIYLEKVRHKFCPSYAGVANDSLLKDPFSTCELCLDSSCYYKTDLESSASNTE